MNKKLIFIGVSLVFLIVILCAFSSAVAVTSCRPLNVSNTVYILQNNVYSNVTCFNIISSNVTFDGNGKTIFPTSNTSSTYYTISVSNSSVNVINTNIVVNNSARIAGGIYYSKSNNGTIYNNNITSYANTTITLAPITIWISNSTNITGNIILMKSGINDGDNSMLLSYSYNSIIANNNLTANGTSPAFQALSLQYSPYTLVYQNLISVFGISISQVGILSTVSNWINITENIISSNSDFGSGISFTSTSNSYITNNSFTINGTQGIALNYAPPSRNGDNNSVTNNTIVCNTCQYGIFVAGSNNVLSSNSITGNFSSPVPPTPHYGIYIFPGYYYNGSNPVHDQWYPSNYNNLSYNYINISRAGGISITRSNFTSIINNSVTNRNASYGDLNVTLGCTVTLVDQTFQDYSFSGLLEIINSLFGKIKFLTSITATGASLFNNVIVSNNSAYVNSSNTLLNVSANVTLYSLPTDFTTAVILRNGKTCPSSVCYNFTDLNSGTAIFNVTGWSNYSIGNSAPSVTLISPLDNSFAFTSKNFQCIANDSYEISNITLFIWNSTKDIINQTTTFTTGLNNISSVNITFGYSDIVKWNCLAYNIGNFSSWADSNFTLNVNISTAIITLNKPLNDTYFNYQNNIDMNCTAEGSNLDSMFLYGNFNGSYILNKSILGITSGNINNFKLNLTDNAYLWSCGVNRTDDNNVIMSQYGNYTFTVDTVYPSININSISGSAGSQTIAVNTTSSDVNPNTCKYTIYDSLGSIDGLNNNISYTCNSDFSATVTAYGTYNLTVSATDKASNSNYSSLKFTVSALSPVIIGGGGGTSEPKARVVALLNPPQDTNEYSALQRAILFARIRNFTLDYGTLTSNQVYSLSEKLAEQAVPVNTVLLNYWIENYNKKQYEVVEVTENQYKQYDLVKEEVIFGEIFSVNPAYINSYTFVSLCDEKDIGKTWEINVKSNKILTNCSSLEGGFLCDITAQSTAKLSYSFEDYSFVTKNLEGQISYISDSGEVARTQIKYLHVINTCGNIGIGNIKLRFWIVSLIVVVSVSGLIYVIIKKVK